MANTSATGGPLLPSLPAPANDLDLSDIIRGLVVGIAGLPDNNVRRRWEPIPLAQPAQDQNWCAVGVERITPADGLAPVLIHDGAGDGSSTLRRYEALDVLASFYGPAAGGYAGLLRDGLTVAQNREALIPSGMTVQDIGPTVAAPELANTVWRQRQDIRVTLIRAVERTYPIKNVAKAVGTIKADFGVANPKIEALPFTAPET